MHYSIKTNSQSFVFMGMEKVIIHFQSWFLLRFSVIISSHQSMKRFSGPFLKALFLISSFRPDFEPFIFALELPPFCFRQIKAFMLAAVSFVI